MPPSPCDVCCVIVTYDTSPLPSSLSNIITLQHHHSLTSSHSQGSFSNHKRRRGRQRLPDASQVEALVHPHTFCHANLLSLPLPPLLSPLLVHYRNLLCSIVIVQCVLASFWRSWAKRQRRLSRQAAICNSNRFFISFSCFRLQARPRLISSATSAAS
jgi:hypothetical protein